MKQQKMKRIVSGFLAFVMVVLMIPFSVFVATAESVNLTEDPTQMLGFGYNAITGESLGVDTLITNSWIDHDKDDTKLYVYGNRDGTGILEQYGKASYAKSSFEFLQSMGIDYTNTTSANFTISGVKAGVTNKFSANFDLSTKTTGSELYYSYVYRAISNRYVLGADYSKYLNADFMAAIDKMASNPTNAQIESFFSRYGTHMLTAFDMGGSVELTSWAISEEKNLDILANLENELSADAGVGDMFKAENSTKLALSFHLNNTQGKYESGVDYRSVGGSGLFADATNPEALNINTENLEAWVATLSGNPAFIASSSQWVAVWEVLPQKAEYNHLRECMYQYFTKATAERNDSFLKRFCSYSNRLTLEGYTYISSDGYVYQGVPYDETTNAVAPGSTLVISKKVDDSVYSIDQISYKIDEASASLATVDRNGTLKISSEARDGDVIKLYMMYGNIVLQAVNFVVQPENRFSGGYGTEARPYLVSSVDDLENISADEFHYLIINDIDFEGKAFSGIPNFSGVLDGGGHRVYGFHISHNTGSKLVNAGFIRVNKGTVRNLIIGNRDYAESITALQGLNKVTGAAAQRFSAWIQSEQYEKNVNNRMSVGALVGWNEGVIDNCHVENVYVRGLIKDQNDNKDSFVYVGMVGTNHGKGVIVRSSTDGNYFEAHASAQENSGDDCHSYVGGICGRSGGLVAHCISANNDLRTDARGNGLSGNKAHPGAIAGGLVGRLSNIAESPTDNNDEWSLQSSVAYGNCISLYRSYVGYTEGKGYAGFIAGQALAKSTSPSTSPFVACWADSESNTYATYDKYGLSFTPSSTAWRLVHDHADIDDSDGFNSKQTLIELNDLANGFDHFALVTRNTNQILAIQQPSGLSVSGGREDYIVGDYLDPQDIRITAKYQDGSLEKDFKVYNGSEFVTANFKVFKFENFTTDMPADPLLTTITVPYGKNALQTSAYAPIVSAVAVEELVIEQLPYRTSYYASDAFDTVGLSLVLKYNNGEVKALTEGYTVSGFDANKLGAQEIVITYGLKTVSYTVTVYRVKPVGILVSGLPEKTNYALGETFDATGLLVTLLYNNGSTKVLAAEEVACAGFDSDSEGSKDVTVSYTYYDEDLGKNCTVIDAFAVNVGTVSAIEIETLPTKLSYYTSDKKVDTAGLSIKVTYTNGVSKTVTGDKAIKVDGYNLSVTGTQEVVVNYQGFRTAYEIEVLPVTLAGVSVKTLPKTQFYVPDQFTASGLVLTLTYVDGSTRDVYEGYIVTVNGYDVGEEPKFLVTGTKTVTVAFEEDGVRKFTEYTIRVAERVMQSIQIVHAPLKHRYKVNESIDTMGMLVYGVFNNGDVMEIKDYVVRTPDLSTVGEKTVKVLYMGTYETEFIVTVVAPERIYIAQMPTKSTYVIGEDFDPTGLVVKAVYWDYSEVILDQGDYSLSDTALSSLGSEKVYVKFGTLQAYFFVQIEEFEVPDDAPKIVIDNANATTGKTVVVNISLKNNPGIASMKLNVAYDQSVLTLTDITYNSEMGGQFQLPQDMDAPVILNWYNGWNNYSEDGVFATLTFTVAEDATHDSYTDIKVTYDPEDVYNILEQNVTFYAEGGDLHVIEYVPGDINGDGEVNNKDVTRMSQYLSGWDVEVCEKALDVNGDGNVNNKDMTRLFQYLSNWDVEIH
ncbi:MAG: bacterial Ig-like domain-containing protein [Clostridia bacterium]|nr:bacterial Ig-like domain-containing protein [Clostridia bacterium]